MTREEIIINKHNLRNADLRNANLIDANLRNADLSHSNLRNADLLNADLSNADLSNADLLNADLSNANLSHSNLRNADLFNAELRNADLLNADLSNANLSNADLRDADLSRALGLPCQDVDHIALRHQVADMIEAHPELHDQGQWGDGSADPECQTPCCVAGWACHLGGSDRKLSVQTAGYLLLGGAQGLPIPSFATNTNRDQIIDTLRKEENHG